MSEEQFNALIGAIQGLTAAVSGLRADLEERAQQPLLVVIVQPEQEPAQPIRGNARERAQQARKQ